MVVKLKLYFQYQDNKKAFSLLEMIISLFIITIIIFGIVNLKNNLSIFSNESVLKTNHKREIYDAALFIENKIKSMDDFELVKEGSYKGIYVFTFQSKIKEKIHDYTYFFFEKRNGKLLYRANNSNVPLRIKNYNTFSNSNYLCDKISNFDISYENNIFKLNIEDKFGNSISKSVLSGVLNEN